MNERPSEPDAAREERIERIRGEVKRGTYKVDAEALGKKLIAVHTRKKRKQDDESAGPTK